MKKINIEEIDSNINSLRKDLIPKMKQVAEKHGDLFYFLIMDQKLKENTTELNIRGNSLDFGYFLKNRRECLFFGGCLIKKATDLSFCNYQYGFYKNEIFKKDIYFTLLFLRPLFIGINKFNMFYNNDSMFYYSIRIEIAYKLVKSIHDDIHSIYGNCYDYGLSNYLSILHDLAIEFGCDLRSSDQKFRDNLKNTGNGCLETVCKAAGFFIFALLMSAIFSGC